MTLLLREILHFENAWNIITTAIWLKIAARSPLQIFRLKTLPNKLLESNNNSLKDVIK